MRYIKNWIIIMKDDDLTPKQWEEIYKLEDNIFYEKNFNYFTMF